jgi:hypothetical protein
MRPWWAGDWAYVATEPLFALVTVAEAEGFEPPDP